jgi:hypothetical protein
MFQFDRLISKVKPADLANANRRWTTESQFEKTL